MKYETLLQSLKQKKYEPLYWLEGEEDFFIDQLSYIIEHETLSEAEKGFNLTVFYGRDADWRDVLNACRRYPMFAEKQVVMLKEAQSMDHLDNLTSYIENPMPTTIFAVTYKHGKLDGRMKLAKILSKSGAVFQSKKLYDDKVPGWILSYVKAKGYTVTEKAVFLLVDHIGNDLARLASEIDKLALNITGEKLIDENAIEKFIGISKEYNVFELQNAIAMKDSVKAMRIIKYFSHNPKAGPIQLLLPTLYAFFQKVYLYFGAKASSDKERAAYMGVPFFFYRDYAAAAKKYGLQGVEKNIVLLHEYNLKSIGINNATTDGSELLKELLVRMID